MLAVSGNRLDVIFSRAATVDEIVAALPLMVRAMNSGGGVDRDRSADDRADLLGK
jgi:hypothetical protein